jgi:O-antigen ligase
MAAAGLSARRVVGRLPAPPRESILIGVIAAGFLVAPNPLWAALFYVGVLPLWGFSLFTRRAVPPADAGTMVGVALILWFTLTTAWDTSAAFTHVLWLWNGLCTLVYFLALRRALRPGAPEGALLVTVLLACALANIAIAFLHLAAFGMVDGRMTGWAEARHPILGASIIGVCVILATGRLLDGRHRRLAGAVVIAGLAFIVLTGSRGPLLAIGGSLSLLLLFVRPRLLLAAAGLGVALIAAVAVAAPAALEDAWARLLQRGWSNRLDIWQLALREIAERPLFGHGPSARLDRASDNFPHDLFLSTLFYSGAVGLLLLLAVLALAARAAWRRPDRVTRWTLLALLAHTVLSGLTDLSQITKGPSPMWYIVWLPVALALGATLRPAVAPARAARPADYPPA